MINGYYVIVRVKSKIHDEHTNVGVLIFGPDGKRLYSKMDSIDRAVKRGDCKFNECLGKMVDYYPNRYEDIEQVKQSLGSTGHAMGMVQMSEIRSTTIYDGVLEEICKGFGVCQ